MNIFNTKIFLADIYYNTFFCKKKLNRSKYTLDIYVDVLFYLCYDNSG